MYADTPIGRIRAYLDARGSERHDVISTAGPRAARYTKPRLRRSDLVALLDERDELLGACEPACSGCGRRTGDGSPNELDDAWLCAACHTRAASGQSLGDDTPITRTVALLVREPGILTHEEEADLRTVLELARKAEQRPPHQGLTEDADVELMSQSLGAPVRIMVGDSRPIDGGINAGISHDSIRWGADKRVARVTIAVAFPDAVIGPTPENERRMQELRAEFEAENARTGGETA